jgi:predicted nuclease of restriction endonuclease-like (RecB) superfamily
VLPPRFPLPWSAYVRLLSVKNEHARHFYEAEALRSGWSVRQLDRQIDAQFYERTALSKNKAAMLTKGAAAKPGDALAPRGEADRGGAGSNAAVAGRAQGAESLR